MITRIRKDIDNKEKGFTLIELLVVIIIIGILAAIAIPLFLNQRKKAVDTSARSDVSTLGKELATWYVDNDGTAPEISIDGDRRYQMAVDEGEESDLGLASDHMEDVDTDGNDNLDWCVQIDIEDGKGTLDTVSYDAKDGLQDDGTC